MKQKSPWGVTSFMPYMYHARLFCFIALQAELGTALQFAERAVRRGNIALQRHDTLVDRVQNPAGLREVFLLMFGGGADPVVGADDG